MKRDSAFRVPAQSFSANTQPADISIGTVPRCTTADRQSLNQPFRQLSLPSKFSSDERDDFRGNLYSQVKSPTSPKQISFRATSKQFLLLTGYGKGNKRFGLQRFSSNATKCLWQLGFELRQSLVLKNSLAIWRIEGGIGNCGALP